MPTLTLPPALEHALAEIALRSGQSADAIAAEAIGQAVEDWRDYLESKRALAQSDPASRVSLGEVRHALGMDD